MELLPEWRRKKGTFLVERGWKVSSRESVDVLLLVGHAGRQEVLLAEACAEERSLFERAREGWR